MQTIHQIQVSAEAWRAFVLAKDAASAAAREAEACKLALGLPSTEELVALLGASESTAAAAVVTNGNGTPIGKLTVSFRSPYSVKGGFVARLT
jgi:hypothetical protein